MTVLSLTIFAEELPIEKVQEHQFLETTKLNAQVIQLSNAQQEVTSVIDGTLEKYFVNSGEKIKQGQKIALIKSIVLSRMSAEYVALKKQLKSAKNSYEAVQRLYIKGLTSKTAFNTQNIKKSAIEAKLNALQSQLSTLMIDTKHLNKATSNFVLYARSSGKVAALLVPQHASVNKNDAIVSIVKEQAFYVKSFLPLIYAKKVKIGDKIVVHYAGKDITTHIRQILPKVDEVTQRIVLLSSVDERVEALFINAYVGSTLYFGKSTKHVAVKKSALSFFQNEWVIFTPNDKKNEDIVYVPQVVKIITQDESYVAIDGIKLGDVYVSDKSYYAKSALLKSSLGDGD